MEPEKTSSSKFLNYIVYVLILGLAGSIGIIIFLLVQADEEDVSNPSEEEIQEEEGDQDSEATSTDSQDEVEEENVDTDSEEENTDDEDTIVPSSNWTIGTKEVHEEGNYYTIDILYPVVAGYSDTQAQADFNETILNFVNAMSDSMKESEPGITPGTKNFVDVTYDVSLSKNDLVSVVIQASTYLGGAHPGTSFYTLTFDLKNDKALELADILTSADYLAAVSVLSKNILIGKGITDDGCWVTDGTSPTIDNFKNFSLSEEGIQIIFEEYQVCAYAMGYQTVDIPFSEVASILNSDIESRVK